VFSGAVAVACVFGVMVIDDVVACIEGESATIACQLPSVDAAAKSSAERASSTLPSARRTRKSRSRYSRVSPS
jgi:hypothetical protein